MAALTECQLCVGIEKANIPAGGRRHLQAVLGIPDILVRIRIRIQLSDPTPFFSDYKDAKKIFFHIFSYNLPTHRHIISSL